MRDWGSALWSANVGSELGREYEPLPHRHPQRDTRSFMVKKYSHDLLSTNFSKTIFVSKACWLLARTHVIGRLCAVRRIFSRTGVTSAPRRYDSAVSQQGRILVTISIGRVLIWREHVAGCSLPLNTESQAIASRLIPKMKKIYTTYLCTYALQPCWWKVLFASADRHHARCFWLTHRTCSHAAFYNRHSKYLLWTATVLFKCYARP